MQISDMDRKILRELQRDCRQTSAAIGEAVGLSASACHRRMRLLEERGAITGYGARLDGERGRGGGGGGGYGMTFFVEVTLENQNEETLTAFERAAENRPEVLECYLTTGGADYLLKVAAPDTRTYEQTYRRVIASLPKVNRIQSSLVMKTVKSWRGYPVGPVG